ncbi:hypothetical protein D3C80_852210 [compost metagenome]
MIPSYPLVTCPTVVVDLTHINLQLNPMDATPVPLFERADTIPATCVPWSYELLGGLGLLSLLPTSYPLISSMYPLLSSSMLFPGISAEFTHKFGERSECVRSIASSTIATTTLLPAEK